MKEREMLRLLLPRDPDLCVWWRSTLSERMPVGELTEPNFVWLPEGDRPGQRLSLLFSADS